ncbi:MAG: hydrolase 2, exosortase A system-associated [Gammaproteobacteria bacterium]|nr:hydrolase 2, exosortase A system-associated [Gammaproteobacteria bacterium]
MSSNTFSVQPFFLERDTKKIFCIAFVPQAIVKSQKINGVVVVPPFAEEMNRSRHLFTRIARRLAESGSIVLLLDLYGTGDSGGDFADAGWEDWKSDILAGIQWLKEQGANSIDMLAMRAGCLLGTEVASETDIRKLVMWQPVLDGRTFLTQFFRLKIAANMTSENRELSTTKAIFELIESGTDVEIAGYQLSSSLVGPMSDAKLAGNLEQLDVDICWCELIADEGREPPLMNRKLFEHLASTGKKIQFQKIVGPPFWGATELVEAPKLIDVSVCILSS